MNANKVYESIIKLLFNVVRTDELKYHLYKNKDYLKKFVNLVNDLLKLEIDDNATYNDQQWAKIFGKAIVIISQEKQRIQKSDKTVNQTYEDYSQFISFTSKEYQINNLDNTQINFTAQDILDDAKLSLDKIAFFDEKENKKEIEAQLAKQKETQKAEANKKDAKSGATVASNNNGQQNQQFNPFYGNSNINLPTHPMVDPRFYPYTKKQKWFPWMKIVLGILVILFILSLIIIPIFIIVQPFEFPKDMTEPLASWPINSSWQKELGGAGSLAELTGKWDLRSANQIQGASFPAIFSISLYVIFGAFISYAFLRKPRVNKEKYRLSYWILVPLVVLAGLNFGSFYQLIDPNTFAKNDWWNHISAWVLGPNPAEADIKRLTADFNTWWDGVYFAKNFNVLQGISIAQLVFGTLLFVSLVVVMIIQPRVDVAKINHANEEYQMAVSAAMQGQTYQMDPSLFDNDDDELINKKSKFKLWIEKMSHKKNKKSKDDK